MLFMQMVKQEAGSNQCGACTVAMLIDRSREEILRAVSDSEKPDYFWLNYMSGLGFSLEDVRNDKDFDRDLTFDGEVFRGHLDLPLGDRYYCSVWTPKGVHAVAIDERGMVFDPSTNAPMTGKYTLAEYLEFNRKSAGTIRVSCCYRVRASGQLKG
jgi:hypothetical protein